MRRLHPAALPALVLALCAALWWTGDPVPPPPDAALAPQAAAPSDSPASPPSSLMAMPERLLTGGVYPELRQRIRARLVGTQALFADDKAFELAREQQVLFATGLSPQTAAQSLLANARRLSDGRQWISYDMRVLAARGEGDTFLLPLPGAASAQAEIDSVELVQGQYRWSGRILGEPGGTFHITQAFADQYAVGSIDTVQGQYLLEAKAGTGWVAPARQEFVLPSDGQDTIQDDVARAKIP